MGFFERIKRIIQANINHLIGQAEDPEKILEQVVMEMQEDLVQLRQAVAQAIATQKRTERQVTQAQENAQEWYRRAQLALQKGDENLAREALTRRKPYQETAESMSKQIEQQSVVVNKLKQDMKKLEQKIAEAKTKKDLYIARARSAVAAQKINEMLGSVNTTSSLSAFERMEEKVLQLEAQSEAITELSTDDLKEEFAQLPSSGEIDAELAAMKAQLVSGTEQVQLPSLPSSTLKLSVDEGQTGQTPNPNNQSERN